MGKSKHLDRAARSGDKRAPATRASGGPPATLEPKRRSRRRHYPVPRPFVKWVGGKGKLLDRLVPLLQGGEGRFHEPFVGGGAVFFALARQGLLPTGGARLSDGNLRLVRTWRAVRDDVQGVLDRLNHHAERHGKDHYYDVRSWDVDALTDDRDVAGWFIYLNKTGFNGLYRVNRKGGFNVPIGRYKNPNICDVDNLRATSAVLQGVSIEHQDFMHALVDVREGDTVYLDPPYVPLSETAWFAHYTELGFHRKDQERLAARALELKQTGVRVVLSNHDTPEVRKLYPRPFRHQVVRVARSVNSDASKRGGVAELVIL